MAYGPAEGREWRRCGPRNGTLYSVYESFYSLQGEGARAGRPAVFVRFAGCNLWSGLERDRADAVCRFCDTQFVGTGGDGGGRFGQPQELARAAAALWPGDPAQPPEEGGHRPYLVFTGGEPLLQLDEPLIRACQQLGFEVAVETNGTLPAPAGIDWLCVSPKAGAEWVQRSGDELKLIYPQQGQDPLATAAQGRFHHLWLQPMDSPQLRENTRLARDFCLRHPQFSLSLQIHKVLGLR